MWRQRSHRRFAPGTRRHRGKGKRRTLRSALDDIAGVGPAKRKVLLNALGSVEGIRSASLDDVATVVGPALAKRVRAALGAEI